MIILNLVIIISSLHKSIFGQDSKYVIDPILNIVIKLINIGWMFYLFVVSPIHAYMIVVLLISFFLLSMIDSTIKHFKHNISDIINEQQIIQNMIPHRKAFYMVYTIINILYYIYVI